MRIITFLLCAVAVIAQSVSINAGGPDVPGYVADHVCGGMVYVDAILGPGVYGTRRFGTTFSCTIPLANGMYKVTLRMIEPNETKPKKRLFTVTANGQQTAPLDLVALAGYRMPYSLDLLVLVGAGNLKLTFAATLGNATVNAIEISPVPPPAPTLPTIQMWSSCSGSEPPNPPTLGWDCAGFNVFTVQKIDGTIIGPLIALPVPDGFTLDQKWSPVN